MPKKIKSHEISYEADSGKVKFHLRRPVFFYAPTALAEGEYDPLVEAPPPSASLELHWVYGYRGRDARNNLHLVASGEVLYYTAATAVLYDPGAHSQRCYTAHTDDISSIAVHPDGETVATGQVKGRDDDVDAAHVRVWSAASLETLHVLGAGALTRGVNALSFCVDDGGALLAAVDDAQEPVLSVWEWADETQVATAKCSSDPVIAATFYRGGGQRLVTNGKNAVAFWQLSDGKLKKKTGVFGRHPRPKYVTAVAFTPEGDVITGDSNGNVIQWRAGEASTLLATAHDGSVFTIVSRQDGDGYFTAGKDGTVKAWDSSFKPVEKEAQVQMPGDTGAVRTLVQLEDRLIAGTLKNAIIKGTMADADWKVVTQGSTDEIWALATHPVEEKFLCASFDKTLTERSTESRSILWSTDLESGVQSCAYSPGGEVIVAGCVDGSWKVFEVESREEVFAGKDGDEPIQCMEFSPDGSFLALGSRDNIVYIYSCEDSFKSYAKKNKCEGHSSFIRSLDFSEDGQYLETNSGDYENLFWNLFEVPATLEDQSHLRDVTWATRNCLLSFQNFGIWPQGVDGTDLNAATGAHSRPLTATGDDFGKVKLFAAPTSTAYAGNRQYGGHSSHVTRVAFAASDDWLLSAGGGDCSVLQWKVL